jgi:hypothetical protein
MAAHGNVASQGHVKLIDEIERLLDVISCHSSTQDSQMIVSTADLEQDIFQWMKSVDNLDQHPI